MKYRITRTPYFEPARYAKYQLRTAQGDPRTNRVGKVQQKIPYRHLLPPAKLDGGKKRIRKWDIQWTEVPGQSTSVGFLSSPYCQDHQGHKTSSHAEKATSPVNKDTEKA